MCNFWPKKWLRSLKKFEWWLLTRELLKQYLTEKQNSCLRSGRYERVDCMPVSLTEKKNRNLSHLLNCFLFSTGLFEVGKYLKELRQLTLDQTKVTDAGFVYVSRHLPKLISLGVEGCKITDKGLIKAAESLTNLEELDLGSNLITDVGIQQAIVHMKGLTDMTLTGCMTITDASIESVIKGMPCLTHLGIEGCLNISEEAVERLREFAKSAISFF